MLALLAACGAERPQVPAGDPDDTASGVPAAPAPQPDTLTPPAEQPQPSAELLTADGWGPLRIGMTRAEVVAAAGEDANPEAVGGPEPEVCDEFRPRNAPQGVLVMIERDTLTRISVSRNTEIATPAGFRIGDAASAVEAAYGDSARVELHKYEEAPARYITVWRNASSAGERRGIRYEIGGDDRVRHLRGGGPSIEYVEGCL